MSRIRAVHFRFYPTLVMLVLLAQRALALGNTIDDSEPELDVVADEFAIPGVRFHLEVDPHEPVRELYAYLPGVAKRRIRLARDEETGRYRGDVPVPERLHADELTIRLVARDRARNRLQHDILVPVLAEFDCCDDEETCGLVPLGVSAPLHAAASQQN